MVVRSHSAPFQLPSAERLSQVGWAVSVLELADRAGRVQSRTAALADPMRCVRFPVMLPVGLPSAQMVALFLNVAAADADEWLLRNRLPRRLLLMRSKLSAASRLWFERLKLYRLPLEAQARIAFCL